MFWNGNDKYCGAQHLTAIAFFAATNIGGALHLNKLMKLIFL
jgi:hypothetical protein